MNLQYLDSSLFCWQTWRSCDFENLGVKCRFKSLTSKRGSDILRKCVIGYCKAEELNCRPKNNCMAVMFLKDNNYFWFHLRNEEFAKIFGE